MASSGLKKMLFFIISNTEGVRVLVCPAIFGHWMGFCGRCFNHQAGVMPVYWLMLLPFFLWQMLLPLLCILLADVIAISLLADVIKTPKGKYIIRKAEKALLNERVRSINNTINMFNLQINTCIGELENQIKKEDMEECYRFIEGRRETRHLKTQKRNLEKFNRLCHRNTGGCSNHTHSGNNSSIGTGGHTNQNTEMALTQQQPNNSMTEPTQEHNNNNNQNWVRNLSRRLLTKAQEKMLSHGSNYAIFTKEPPIGEYIAQVEEK